MSLLTEMAKKNEGLDFVGEQIENPAYFGNGLGIATNHALKAIKENGEYQKIYDKWMSAN